MRKYLRSLRLRRYFYTFLRHFIYFSSRKAPVWSPALFGCQLSPRSSLKHFAQTFFPRNTDTSLTPSQKMQLGRYFLRMTDDPSTYISSASLSVMSSVRRSSMGSTILPSSSDCVNQVQKIFVRLRKALKYKDSSAFGAFTPVLLIESF